ncbi:hypothetical protein ABK040_000158 [Willaertia magna]
MPASIETTISIPTITTIHPQDNNNTIIKNNNSWLQNVSDACYIGDLESLEILLAEKSKSNNSKQFNVNQLDNNKLSPIHRACSKNQSQILMRLLDIKDIDVKIRDSVSATPLHLAIANNAMDCIMILASVKNAKQLVEIRDCYGRTPFHVAFKFRNYEAMKLLIQIFGTDIVNTKTNSSETCLHIAAKECDLTAIKFLLNNNAKLMKDENGNTPLGAAIVSSAVVPINLLSPRNASRSCAIPYQKAEEKGCSNSSSAKQLQRRHFSKSQELLTTTIPLVRNVQTTNSIVDDYLCYSILIEEEIAKIGLNKWKQTDVDIARGRNIIQVACQVGNSKFLSLCALMIEKEVYQEMLMATDKYGKNSLHLACEGGHVEIIQQILLLMKDIEKSKYCQFINQQDEEKNTPFHCAVMMMIREEGRVNGLFSALTPSSPNSPSSPRNSINNEVIRKISQCIMEFYDNPYVNYELRNNCKEKVDDLLQMTSFYSQVFLGIKSSALYTKRISAKNIKCEL